MHSTASTAWRSPTQILFFAGCFPGFPREEPEEGSFRPAEDLLSHWLLNMPAKPGVSAVPSLCCRPIAPPEKFSWMEPSRTPSGILPICHRRVLPEAPGPHSTNYNSLPFSQLRLGHPVTCL